MIQRRLVNQSSVGIRKFDAHCGFGRVIYQLVLGSCTYENAKKTRTAKSKIRLSMLQAPRKYH